MLPSTRQDVNPSLFASSLGPGGGASDNKLVSLITQTPPLPSERGSREERLQEQAGVPSEPDALVDYCVDRYGLVNAELLLLEWGVDALRWGTIRMEAAAQRDRLIIDRNGNEHVLSQVRSPAGLIAYLTRQYGRVRGGRR